MTINIARAALLEACGELNVDELRVLVQIAKRMSKGRKAYGPLNLATDQRDQRQELLEELLDGCAYGAMALIKERG